MLVGKVFFVNFVKENDVSIRGEGVNGSLLILWYEEVWDVRLYWRVWVLKLGLVWWVMENILGDLLVEWR